MESKLITLFVGFLINLTVAFGQISFNRVYSGTGTDEGQGIIQLADSGFVVAGTSSSFQDAPSQAFLMRLNKQGYVVWSKAFGGTESELGRRVILRPGVGYYLFGTSNSGASGDFDMYVAHTDLNGTLIWEKHFDNGGWERLHDAVMLADTSFVLVGESDSNVVNLPDRYMLRMDKDGAVIWQQQNKIAGDDMWRAISLQSDTTFLAVGSQFVADSSLAKGYIARYHIDGTKLWDTLVGKHGEYRLNEIHFINNVWCVLGQSYVSAIDDYNGYILRMSPTFQSYGTDDAVTTSFQERLDQFTAFTAGGSQNFCVAAQKYNPGYSFAGGEDCEVSEYTSTLIWGGYGVNYGTIGQDEVGEMIPTNDGYVAFVGFHHDQNVGGSSCFVVKIGQEFSFPSGTVTPPLSILSLNEQEEVELDVYPNPMQNVVYVQGTDLEIQAISILNNAGQVVMRVANANQIDVSALSSGVYFMHIESSKGLAMRKMVK